MHFYTLYVFFSYFSGSFFLTTTKNCFFFYHIKFTHFCSASILTILHLKLKNSKLKIKSQQKNWPVSLQHFMKKKSYSQANFECRRSHVI